MNEYCIRSPKGLSDRNLHAFASLCAVLLSPRDGLIVFLPEAKLATTESPFLLSYCMK